MKYNQTKSIDASINDEIAIAIQHPKRYIFLKIPKNVPKEIPITMYEMKFDIITNFVFFNPL